VNDLEYRHLVEVYAKQQASLIAALVQALIGLWVPFRWASRPDMINAWAAQSAVQADIAAVKARQIARAYMIAQLRGLDALPDNLPAVEDIYPRSGTPIVEVYKRPARQFEYAESQGKTLDEATQILTERLEKIVSDDITAVARDDANKVMEASPKVIGYRRIIHPELSKTGTCGLCVVAADRFYSRGDLMSIHDLCKCTVGVMTANSDPGLKLNREDLDALYEAAGSNYGEDLKKIRVQTSEHGELGPILTRKGDEFKTVSRVNREAKRQTFTPYERPTAKSNKTNWAVMKNTSERSIQILQDAKANGTNLVDMTGRGRPVEVKDLDKAIEYHLSLIARASRYL